MLHYKQRWSDRNWKSFALSSVSAGNKISLLLEPTNGSCSFNDDWYRNKGKNEKKGQEKKTARSTLLSPRENVSLKPSIRFSDSTLSWRFFKQVTSTIYNILIVGISYLFFFPVALAMVTPFLTLKRSSPHTQPLYKLQQSRVNFEEGKEASWTPTSCFAVEVKFLIVFMQRFWNVKIKNTMTGQTKTTDRNGKE